MKKILLIPIALSALAPTISMVGCGEKDPIGEWIEWDYKDGEYVNDSYQPLQGCPENPISAGFDKIAENPNNIIYDHLLYSNSTFFGPSVECNKGYIEVKINSYNEQTHVVDFEINENFDVTAEGMAGEYQMIRNVSLTCHHIILDVYLDKDRYYFLGTPVKQNESSQSTYNFLTSDASGDWSITGSYYEKVTAPEYPVKEIEDKNCQYSKATINDIYQKDQQKWECLWKSYEAISLRMYYLQNCHN